MSHKKHQQKQNEKPTAIKKLPPTRTKAKKVAHKYPSKTKKILSKVKQAATIPQKNKIMNEAIQNADFIPEEIPIKEAIGKKGLMWPRTLSSSHKAADVLTEWAEQGCPVDCGDQWSEEQIITALKRGPHPSARQPEAKAYLQKETQAKIKAGHMKVVKWKDIKGKIPSNMKISPVALIPHKSRSFRVILDLSHQLRMKGKKCKSVNDSTIHLAPQAPMKEIGLVLKRIIHTMVDNYMQDRPFAFAKLDIKDGFWRMSVSETDAWNFCYVLPAEEGTALDELEIVVPTSLQMGWCESPPLFCTATETARDTIQALIDNINELPEHDLETKMLNARLLFTNDTEGTTHVHVYVDDFIGLTNLITHDHLKQVSRAMLHGVHSMFPPPNISGHNGEDPVSIKKLTDGEGTWEHVKEILGWIFDGIKYTVQLPKNKNKKLQNLLSNTEQKSKVSLKEMQQIMGKLMHASFGIPTGQGLMAPLYRAVRGDPAYIKITKPIKQALRDWKTLLHRVTKNPTSVRQLVEDDPNYLGWCDACKYGAGGIWIGGSDKLPYVVWRITFPNDVQQRLKTKDNPKGDLSINDLEMAGVLLQWLVLEQITTDLKFKHTSIFCDNTSSVAWTNKLSATSVPGAFLIRALALRQHIKQASPLVCFNIEGEFNRFADIASRFKHQQMFDNNSHFLTFFNKTFPLQNNAWSEYTLPKRLVSQVISCLRGKPLEMASWIQPRSNDKDTGLSGSSTPESFESRRTSITQQQSSETSSSQHSLQEYAQVSLDEGGRLRSAKSRKRLRPSQKQSSWLEK